MTVTRITAREGFMYGLGLTLPLVAKNQLGFIRCAYRV